MMIEFVMYFSTADEAVGYVAVDALGTAPAEFIGGPTLPPGIYRVEQGVLTRVAEPSANSNPALAVGHEDEVAT